MPELQAQIDELRQLVQQNIRPGSFTFTKDVRFEGGARLLGAVYLAGFQSNGTAISLPTGWSVVHNGTGSYTVTHNLGTTSYFLVPAVDSTGKASAGQIVTVQNLGANTFDLTTVDFGNAAIDNKIYFFLMRY